MGCCCSNSGEAKPTGNFHTLPDGPSDPGNRAADTREMTTNGAPAAVSSVARPPPKREPVVVELVPYSYCGRPINPQVKGLHPDGDMNSYVWQKTNGDGGWVEMGAVRNVPQPYTPTVDDVNCKLRIRIQPVAGGARAPATYSNLTTVGIDRAMCDRMFGILVAGEETFNVSETDATGAVTPWQLALSNLSFAMLKQKKRGPDFKKIEDVKWGTMVSIVLNPVDTKALTIHYYNKASNFQVENAHNRDVLVLAFRLFHALGTEDICEEVCGPELAARWRKGKVNPKGRRELLDAAFRMRNGDFPPKTQSRGYDSARDTLIAFKQSFSAGAGA